jgi:ParB family chromosome partitioning protein
MVAHAIAGSPLWNVKIENRHCRNEAIAESVETGMAETLFDAKRRAVLALLDFSPEEPTVAGGNGKEEGTAEVFARLIGLDDEAVLTILAVVMGETMQAGSAVVEAVGACLKLDMATLWTPDDALFDLVRDRQVANAMLREVAGKKVADGMSREGQNPKGDHPRLSCRREQSQKGRGLDAQMAALPRRQLYRAALRHACQMEADCRPVRKSADTAAVQIVPVDPCSIAAE